MAFLFFFTAWWLASTCLEEFSNGSQQWSWKIVFRCILEHSPMIRDACLPSEIKGYVGLCQVQDLVKLFSSLLKHVSLEHGLFSEHHQCILFVLWSYPIGQQVAIIDTFLGTSDFKLGATGAGRGHQGLARQVQGSEQLFPGLPRPVIWDGNQTEKLRFGRVLGLAWCSVHFFLWQRWWPVKGFWVDEPGHLCESGQVHDPATKWGKWNRGGWGTLTDHFFFLLIWSRTM